MKTEKSSPINICFVTTGVNFGGAERQLITFLREFDRDLLTPTVITVLSADSPLQHKGGDFRGEIRELNIPLESLDLRKLLNPVEILRLYKKIACGKFDLIHIFGLRVDFIARFALLFGRNKKLIASIRSPYTRRSDFIFRLDGITSSAVSPVTFKSGAAQPQPVMPWSVVNFKIMLLDLVIVSYAITYGTVRGISIVKYSIFLIFIFIPILI